MAWIWLVAVASLLLFLLLAWLLPRRLVPPDVPEEHLERRRVQIDVVRAAAEVLAGAFFLVTLVLGWQQLQGTQEQLEVARDAALSRWGRVDVLVNAAGGNVPAATVGDDSTIFDLPLEAFEEVIDLNLLGTLLPIQVFGEAMTRRAGPEASAEGCLVNVSSMAASRPLTGVVGYSAAKAAVENPRS